MPLYETPKMAASQGVKPRPSLSESEALSLCNEAKVVGIPRFELGTVGSRPSMLPLHYIPKWLRAKDSNLHIFGSGPNRQPLAPHPVDAGVRVELTSQAYETRWLPKLPA